MRPDGVPRLVDRARRLGVVLNALPYEEECGGRIVCL